MMTRYRLFSLSLSPLVFYDATIEKNKQKQNNEKPGNTNDLTSEVFIRKTSQSLHRFNFPCISEALWTGRVSEWRDMQGNSADLAAAARR